MQRPTRLDLFDCPVEQVNKLQRRCGGFRPLRSVTAMGRCPPSAWTGSWTGVPDTPSTASAISVITRAIGAASAHDARGRASCKRQASGSNPLTGSQVREGAYPPATPAGVELDIKGGTALHRQPAPRRQLRPAQHRRAARPQRGGATTLRHYDPVPEVDRRAAAYLAQLTARSTPLSPQPLTWPYATAGRSATWPGTPHRRISASASQPLADRPVQPLNLRIAARQFLPQPLVRLQRGTQRRVSTRLRDHASIGSHTHSKHPRKPQIMHHTRRAATTTEGGVPWRCWCARCPPPGPASAPKRGRFFAASGMAVKARKEAVHPASN